MSDYGMTKYAGETAGSLVLCPRQPSPRERLQGKLEMLEEELAAVNAAIKALDDNPNIEQVMTLVQRAL